MSSREFRLSHEYSYDRRGPVRWIVSHVLRYPLFPLGMLAATILNNVFYSSIQVFVGRAFDLIDRSGFALDALLSLALYMLVAAVLQAATGLARNWSAEFVAQRTERDAREELYASLLGKSQTFHGRQRVGDIMARTTNDVHMLNLMISPALWLITDATIGTLVPLIVLALMNPALLLVPVLWAPLFGITLARYIRQLRPVSDSMREQFGTLNAGLAEAITGIEVVKANTREGYERDRFMRDARGYRDFFIQQGEIEARYLPLLVFSAAWAGAFLHGLWLWQGGVLSLGQVVTYVGLIGTLRFPTFISIWTFDLMQQGVACARRILELINTETDLDENPQGLARPIRGEVVFENVSFGYDGAPVLRGISFRAQPGETVAIVGQTGSGKTTLTRLINRIFDATEGRVLVDGADVRDWSLESLRGQISTIEQDVFLFSRTLAENIAFGCAGATQEQIEAAAQAAQAHDFITDFREGYRTEVGERGVTLSGGQRQRIAIARAFLTDPRILILDDSTSAIDSATEDQIQRAMRRISRERTTFIITHRLSQIRWADRILVLHRGELADQGTHDELMARSDDYRRIFARYE